MHRACARFRRGRVAIIGSDIPQAMADDVAFAFHALGRSCAAFGPAEDGGYWLVGLGPRRPAHPFAAVRWSSPHALEDTLVNFVAHRSARLRTLRDVDHADDLLTLVSAGGWQEPRPHLNSGDADGHRAARFQPV
jgi:hypothetical protein